MRLAWAGFVSFIAIGVAGCTGASPPPPAVPPASGPRSLPTTDLPAEPPRVPASELEGDFACGPFRSNELDTEQRLLADRLRVRFLAGATAVGDDDAGALQIVRDGVKLFVGARETYTAGDAHFSRRAAKIATFGGNYDPVVIGSPAGDVVTGVMREMPSDKAEVALAHGWFLDGDRNALDVAVFVSASAVGDGVQCRRFAQKVIASATQGARKLAFSGTAVTETKVSFATFRYRLPSEWRMTSAEGIHDFAHIHFRRRGTFPVESVELAVGLDSHPGDSTPPGVDDGERTGKVLGLPLVWKMKKEAQADHTHFGAFGISTERSGQDHAIAAFQWAGTVEERDEAMRFAESITVVK